MPLVILLTFFLFFSPSQSVSAQTTTINTTLTEPNQIREFMDSTERIRCICLPSLPIQGCSYNMCIVSSYLKTLIENRIRLGETSNEIVAKFENGFGDDIRSDSVFIHFEKEGNERMLNGLLYGFGAKIQAKPDSTWINLSLAGLGLLALIGIGFYVVQRKKSKSNISSSTAKTDQQMLDLEKKYLSEL
ncbi:cytochrome C biogenesis protein [Leptospira sp. GIMC2001]|uniref:cytochrome C biogenesis protein n=1 Tax=Leptospira sp. GIMC2001 TaxID=1513297 RepID=UPI002349FFA4|nr:cytochrome C biogenesis protein [Leptospira sp. GIMC2001]WCL48794.1 cytochrome C biogenesis protein [Leptospira sp. GIMC2001]